MGPQILCPFLFSLVLEIIFLLSLLEFPMTPEEAELWPGGSVLFHHPPCLASGRFSHCGKQQRSQMLTRTHSPGVSPSLRQPLTQASLCLALGVSSPQRRARDTRPLSCLCSRGEGGYHPDLAANAHQLYCPVSLPPRESKGTVKCLRIRSAG